MNKDGEKIQTSESLSDKDKISHVVILFFGRVRDSVSTIQRIKAKCSRKGFWDILVTPYETSNRYTYSWRNHLLHPTLSLKKKSYEW